MCLPQINHLAIRCLRLCISSSVVVVALTLVNLAAPLAKELKNIVRCANPPPLRYRSISNPQTINLTLNKWNYSSRRQKNLDLDPVWDPTINPSPPKGGYNNPRTVFAPVLKNAQPRGKIAPRIFKFILSPHFSDKNSNLLPPGGRVSFQSCEVKGGWCNPVILKLNYFESFWKLESSFFNILSKQIPYKLHLFFNFLPTNQFLPIFYIQNDNFSIF